jgi:C1A family cysteine protease
MVYEDQASAEKSGVFSPDNCQNGKCTKTAGGHAVLITGLKNNPSASGDPIDALIIKNSWGNIGLDDKGQTTANAADRGYFLITPPYLSLVEDQASSNGWSILVQKKFLPSK